MNRVTRKLVSMFCIATLLFAQLAVSAFACPVESAGAGAQMHVASASDAAMNCHDAQPSALCRQHCESDQQNVNDSIQPLAFVALAPAFVTTLDVTDTTTEAQCAPGRYLVHATAPPLSIRNCCFRI